MEGCKAKNIIVTDMYSHITAFEVRLCLWEVQLATGQFMHFPRIVACAPDDVDLNICVGVITSLREENASRFTGVRSLAPGFKLITSPCDFDKLKAKYRTASPLSFFRDLVLPSKIFQNYIKHVKRIVVMFGSTYCRKQLFKNEM